MINNKRLLFAVYLSTIALLATVCGISGKSSTDTANETAVSAESNQEEQKDSEKTVSKEADYPESPETETSGTTESTSADTEAENTEITETANMDTENTEMANTETDNTETVNTESEDTETENTEIADPVLSSLMDQVVSSLPANNGNWSFYVCDLSTGHESSYQSHSMQAASLIKLYIMGAVYEDYDNLVATYGQENIDNNLYYMITVSDNDCANQLTNYLGYGDSDQGMSVVTCFCLEHGFYDSSMGRLLLASNENGDNWTSVSDCGHFLKAIRSGNSEEFPHADDMFNLLSQQQRRNKIPSQLPEGVSVANKTGELDNVENDAGIIYNVQNELVLVFMSDSLLEVGTAQTTIGSLSNMIYSYYNQ